MLRLLKNPVDFTVRNFPQPFGLVDLVICFAAVLLVPGILAASLVQLFGAESAAALNDVQRNVLLITLALSQIVLAIVTIGISVLRYGPASKFFGIQAADLRGNLLLAAKTFAMVIPPLLLMQLLLSLIDPYEHDTLSDLKERFTLPTITINWFGAVIAAPFCEEVLFRGYLQGWMQRINFALREDPVIELGGGWPISDFETSTRGKGQFEWWFPIIVSSAFFAAVHIGQGLAPIPLFFFGLALGFLYRYSGSIVPCIILHFLLNAMSMSKATLDIAVQ